MGQRVPRYGEGKFDAVKALLEAGADPEKESRVGLSLTPGCQIGYMDHTGCHQLVL
jgi:hypothetical protein